MEFNTKKDELLKNKKLKKKIINEYLYIIFTILILNILLPLLTDYMIGDNTGIDGIGQALGIVGILSIFKYIITFIVFAINPIRILFSYKNDFREIFPKIKKVMYIIVTILPILFSLLIILEVPISNYMYSMRYETGKGAYSLTSDEYKTPKDFEIELEKRGFISNSEQILSKLNRKYGNKSKYLSEYYYEEASLMPLFTKLDYFSDTKDYNDIITFDSNTKAPGYVYNTILYLYDKNDVLQYAPISRYDGHTYLNGTFYPFYQDYYIECKILYVDGDIYAIIGVGQSYDIQKYFEDQKKDYSTFYTYPYNMILSEKDSITTFVNDKYYPDGAIENKGGSFEMVPNTNKRDGSELYSVRKVDKLDVNTINDIAKELQNGILKDSIEYHFSK